MTSTGVDLAFREERELVVRDVVERRRLKLLCASDERSSA
jgi:hypothetical protein